MDAPGSRSHAWRELALRQAVRGIDADLLDVDPTDPASLATDAGFTFDSDAGPIDYLNDVPGAAAYDGLRDRAIETTAAGVLVRVAGLDDLIRMKRASGRPRDLRDIANLTARDPDEGP